MRRGLALILIVGVLGILAVLGSAFAVLSRLERRAASQRVSSTQAFLLARSGVEDAQARLDAGQDPAYGGEDWDRDGTLNGFEGAAEVTRPGLLDTETCPVRQALRPSFFVKDPSSLGADLRPAPRRVRVDGRERGYSGSLSSGTWAVKALPQGGFFVNGGDPSAAATVGYNLVLRRILGTLAEAIDREDGANDGLPVDQGDGEKLIILRPQTERGWESWNQIRDLAFPGTLQQRQAKLDALKSYLTLYAWVDRKVVCPNLIFTEPGIDFGTWWEYKVANHAPGMGLTVAPDFERIGTRVVGRAPVDLSWARKRRPALLALLANLRGAYLDEGGMTIRATTLALDWAAPSDDCRRVAGRILSSTSDLATWDQWNGFCDTLSSDLATGLAGGSGSEIQAKRDILKANFNPNSDLNKFNPDPAMARLVDKSDLLAYSTEFNLVPRGGARVSAAGRLLDKGGRVLATRILSEDLLQDRMVRLTTQTEFAAGNLGDLDRAGDETGFRTLGSAPFITESHGTGPTFAHRLNLGGYLTGDSRGASLQTLPEPLTAAPAAWDGQVRLATTETGQGEDYQGVPIPGSQLFLARWADRIDADYGSAGNVAAIRRFVPPTPFPPASNSVLAPDSPGMLYPDGVYLEESRVPGYRAPGNMAPHRGTLSFWCKPSWIGHQFARAHIFVNNSRGKNNPGFPNSPYTAAHWLGWWPETPSSMNYSWKFLIAHWEGVMLPIGDPHDDDNEQISYTWGGVDLPRRWFLLTHAWEDGQFSTLILKDRGRPTARYMNELNVNNLYSPGLPTTTFDYQTAPCGTRPATIFLGPEGWTNFGGSLQMNGLYPDSTYDEFAIYDFGADAQIAQDASHALARARFEIGRFYKESAYPAQGGLRTPPGAARRAAEWFSAPLPLGQARVLRLAWTQIVPRDLKAPAALFGTFLPEGGDPGPDARIVFELAHKDVQVPATPGGPDYALDASGRKVDALLLDSRGERIARRLSSPFRLHAVFQPRLADPLGKAILDPLVLDDVTVTYRPVDRPMFSAWREGE